MNKQLVMALLASGALVGLAGCSDGDEATIVIDAPTTDNSQANSNNTTTTTPAPAPAPDDSSDDDADVDSVPCPDGTTETAADVCELSGSINSDLTLVAGNTYTLSGRVQVGNGSADMATANTLANGDSLTTPTLTIEPGVQVLGLAGDETFQTVAVLQVNRGAKIMAVGTAEEPIVFSSEDDGLSGPREWGGVIISGFAPHNSCSDDLCNITAEGGAGKFGQVAGSTPDDNSGMLKYVVITEGGFAINAEGDEINGLSLNGVGSGTVLEYIQVHDNVDDGIEFYGGTVNMKYAVVTAARDDSVDWDEGYQGNLQYVMVRQSPFGGGEAFEMDTLSGGIGLFPSKPTVSNVTIIADKNANDDSYIMQFKEATGGFFHNVVATVASDSPNTFDTCARIRGGAEDNVGTSLVFNNWIQDCANAPGDHGELATVDMTGAAVNVNATFANLNSLGASTNTAAKLDAPLDWVAINTSFGESVADADYLDATDYIGAVDPDATTAWWAGWTVPGSVGTPDAVEIACPEGTTETADNVCQLEGVYNDDLRLVAGNTYTLSGRVQFGNGAEQLDGNGFTQGGAELTTPTLTIDAGVEVKGLSGDGTYQTVAVLQINRGAKIMAEGTATAPIIFSSEDEDNVNPREWGGVIISGFGRHNSCTDDLCNIIAEGGAGYFGQTNGEARADNSGKLRYVVITEGGFAINAEGDEINGLSLNGVGSGTELEYIQVHDNVDDGIEFYGGDVNVKYAVVTAARDDSIDWDEGYRGNMQYVIVKQSNLGSGEAFEMDTLTSSVGEWLSKPTVANVTVIAAKQTPDDPYIMQFKENTGGFFHNVIATVADDSLNTFDSCARIRGGSESLVNTALVFNNWIQDCANDGLGGTLTSANSGAGADAVDNDTVVIADPALDAILASQAPEAVLAAPLNWTEINGAFSESTANTSYLDATDFIGAVNPDGSNPWWAGWTLPGTL